MPAALFRTLALVLAVGTAAPVRAEAPATATLRFLAPEAYVDGNLGWSPVDQRLTFEGLSRICAQEARRLLPAGHVLAVDIIALDLAGRIDPLTSRNGETRVMRPDTWPSMTLRYRLMRGARVVAHGEATLRAMDYLADPRAARSGEPLRYERAMIVRWLRERFEAPGIG